MTLAMHEFVEGWCLHCGLRENPNAAQYGCLQREIGISDLMPEPKRREYACDDADIISARLIELAKERVRDGEPEP